MDSKVRHFEDTWNESEAVVDGKSSLDRIEVLKSLLQEMATDIIDGDKENVTETFGEIMHELTGISKEQNINSDYALKLATEKKKIDTYG